MGRLFANPISVEDNGLCAYFDPDDWFDARKYDEAKRICGNCPLRRSCARTALDSGMTNGVWGGVDVAPGGAHGTAEQRAAARRQLEFVAAGMDGPSEAELRRNEAIREAVHAAAFPEWRTSTPTSARSWIAVRDPAVDQEIADLEALLGAPSAVVAHHNPWTYPCPPRH
ncbi:MAG: WhiB family transcriptional regulator [Actinomycetia bacterium]|nr:WhiB family transcriptional regulator [Actinomycetes bacterium]